MVEVTANAIEERLIDFAVRIIKVADALPSTSAGKHIARQLLRSGTSPAPNYAEARGAESRADFIHKLKVALKELHESCVRLRMVWHADLMKMEHVKALIDENQQLCRILNASITTSKRKKDGKWQMNDKSSPDTSVLVRSGVRSCPETALASSTNLVALCHRSFTPMRRG